jgi:phosphotransferase system  glucose/maltose/N-acetylglucosamine-specific IIC component
MNPWLIVFIVYLVLAAGAFSFFYGAMHKKTPEMDESDSSETESEQKVENAE